MVNVFFCKLFQLEDKWNIEIKYFWDEKIRKKS